MGEYGDFMGTLQQISAPVVGEMWGLRYCSTARRLGISKEIIGQDDIKYLTKMCFLSLEDAEACAEHHMGICQRVQQKRQRKTTRKQDDKNC